MKEVQLGCYAGPFDEPPFENYIQSPIGLVPKDKRRKTRLIFHLSYDFGEQYEEKSVNFHIPDEACKVKYRDIDYAVRISLKLINEILCNTRMKTVLYSKTDLLSAFRAVPLRISDFSVLVMAVEHLISGERKYFCDQVVPFGSGSSCKIYTEFSNCLHHIVEHKIG